MSDDMTKRWPVGRSMSTVVTVDFFDDTQILRQIPAMAGREKSLSVWQYGATRGVERMLRAFDDAGIKASWFIPGVVARRHPGLVKEIAAAGHEVANATDACDDLMKLSDEEARASILAAQEALAELTGSMPCGFRAPFENWPRALECTIADCGLTWSSSWRGDDLPYFHHHSGARLVEIPLHYELEDAPFFAFNLYPPVPSGQSRIASYGQVLEGWKQDFAGFRRFGLCYTLRLHPEIIGTVGRIGMLSELLQHLTSVSENWIATGSEVSEWWRSNRACNAEGHPVDVFAALQPRSLP
ncbi:polysaccharide deacetylase family protein [Variovorax sp. J31P207]|uniref:polysaccharide deacetylase family protein n=1 Tax=Variovorax sp. J31P207 TaxID=3053510 RepID=UPI002577408E|nr:polysaccharide deacetylase family protein [Variovorax sp. J31P207]MDM0071586.1 polysaccharide deacetylase family protein [Variovorax sp. J31P207]